MLHSSFSPNPSCHTQSFASAEQCELQTLFSDKSHCDLALYHERSLNHDQASNVCCHQDLSVFFGAFTLPSLALRPNSYISLHQHTSPSFTHEPLHQTKSLKQNHPFSLPTLQPPDQKALYLPRNDPHSLDILRPQLLHLHGSNLNLPLFTINLTSKCPPPVPAPSSSA